MDSMQALDVTSDHFCAMVGEVGPAQWAAPTPCEQWTVRSLVGHVIACMHGYADLVHGAPASRLIELGQQHATIGGDDLWTAVVEAAADVRAAFAEPGALDRTVHHPMGDLPGGQLLRLRVLENVVHGWDLATALHRSAVIDEDLADDVYRGLLPMAAILPATGYFAAPRRSLEDDAGSQERLLTLVGR